MWKEILSEQELFLFNVSYFLVAIICLFDSLNLISLFFRSGMSREAYKSPDHSLLSSALLLVRNQFWIMWLVEAAHSSSVIGWQFWGQGVAR